jgi:K+-sensing histidine kinase KdpD
VGQRNGMLRAVDEELFNGGSLATAIVATVAIGLALVLVPTLVAVPVLVAVAFACGRLGGRDAGIGSVSAGAFMFGYAITEPHFVWEIENRRDDVLIIVLFIASLLASEVGARLRARSRARQH